MDKTAATILIRATFNNPFDKERFRYFSKNLLNSMEESTFTYRGNYIPDSFRSHVRTLERIGKYVDPEGNKIDILVVQLIKDRALEFARTTQRNFAAWYLDGSRGGEQKDAALVAFVSPNNDDWRFSLVKMDYSLKESKSGKLKAEKELTPARRWSFLVGTNENSHTAQKQLIPLLQDETMPLLSDLEQAFNIETVTKEFFEKYRGLFFRVTEELDELLKKDALLRVDFTSKGVDTADFAKKLLGQIVFLYFLQKKGWFGVEKNREWGTGPKNFLRQLFEKKLSGYQNFFNDVLEPLFYEALATDRGAISYYDRFKCRIPFLNGGLFDPPQYYSWEKTDIVLPNELFSNQATTKEGDVGTGIIDIFDRYNFTVKEDEPLEKEVAVDPEMLGKVFENLLEVKDRKSKGTYYTPREIVHYMCQESLVNYLATELEDIASKEDLELLVKLGETAIEHDTRIEMHGKETSTYSYKVPESIRINVELIDEKLANIRVCDPAIGSGAFPVGMMGEIVRVRDTLTSYIKEKRDRSTYDLKRHTIQNCLYGVDIDPGAVEIAKLRLWLSLVVDEEDLAQIKPLPNLDYKIMQGNSLLEEYEGIKLFDENLLTIARIDHQATIDKVKAQISVLSRKYFDLNSRGKLTKVIKQEIENEVKNHKNDLKKIYDSQEQKPAAQGLFDLESEAEKRADQLKRLHTGYFEASSRSRKDELKKKIETLEWDLIEATLRENNKESALDQLKNFRNANTKPFFLWKLHFAEVFQEKGGFDVVIANPPYLEARSPDFDDDMKRKLQKAVERRWPVSAELVSRGSDLLIYFFELGLYVANAHGSVVFITQNSWLDTDYGKKFQRFLMNNTCVKAIIDSDYKYFDSSYGPNINTVISLFEGKNPSENNEIVFARVNKNFSHCPLTPRNLVDVSSKFRVVHYSDVVLDRFKWGILLSVDDTIIQMIEKLFVKGKKIEDMLNVAIGQGINLSRDFLVDGKLVREFNLSDEVLIPIHSKKEGAPFVLEDTATKIIDSNRISPQESKSLRAKGIKLFDPKSTTKVRPILILPRGVSRHYCAYNLTGAYSDSGVDIYNVGETLADEDKLNLWLFLNSSICWLLREISGRKNLGGGLLKAEATDLKAFPVYYQFGKNKEIQRIYQSLKGREALATIEEIKTPEHKDIDRLVFNYLEIDDNERKKILNELELILNNRFGKART